MSSKAPASSNHSSNRKQRRTAESQARRGQALEERGRSDKKRGLRERRFTAETQSVTPLAVATGALGALALGAGVHSQWVHAEPFQFAPYLIAGGAAALLTAVFFGDVAGHPVRVGDAGVAVEKRGELSRILWCDMKAISLKEKDLVLSSEELELRIPAQVHPVAIQAIIREAEARQLKVLKLSSEERARFNKEPESLPKRAAVEGLQLTGRKCAVSNKSILMERDARVCPTCCQVFLESHVPKVCPSCEQPIGSNALALS